MVSVSSVAVRRSKNGYVILNEEKVILSRKHNNVSMDLRKARKMQ
jgi:hypothetical protein